MIYGIFHKNHVYIGRSKNPKQRYYSHLSSLRRNKHYSFSLQQLFNEVGENSLELSVLDTTTDEAVAERCYVQLAVFLNYTVHNLFYTSKASSRFKELLSDRPQRSLAISKANRDRWAEADYRDRMHRTLTEKYNTAEYIEKQKKSHPGKPFEVYKNNVIVGTFQSINECIAHLGGSSGNWNRHLNRKPNAQSVKGYTGRYIQQG